MAKKTRPPIHADYIYRDSTGEAHPHAEYALAYAERGWPVFPVRPRGKAPLTEHGFKDASTDPEPIRDWWKRRPDAGIGVPTGTETFIALDLDRDETTDGVETAKELYGFEIDGPAARTGGGGIHAYYRHPGGAVKHRTGENAIAPGVELKGDGGYVILPPSLHPSGERYEWIEDPNLELPEPPPWLMQEIEEGRRAARQRAGEAPERIPEGRRNDTLTSLAGSMRRRGMDAPEIAPALLAVNERRCDPPLPEEEVWRIARGIERYEAGDLFEEPD